MSTLINHKGAEEITLDKLRKLRDPIPLSPTHNPIRHDRFIDLVKETAAAEGLTITREEYSLKTLAPGDDYSGFDDLFGIMDIKSLSTDQTHCLGIRGSNRMNFSRQLGAGNRVMVCDNLAFCAQVVVGRKHTLNIEIDLPDLMRDAIREVTCLFDYDAVRSAIYKDTRLTDAKAHDVMMRSIQGGTKEDQTPASKLGAWVAEWQAPKFDDFLPRNAWSLLNAHTEIAKAWGFDAMARRTEKVQGILDHGLGVHSKAKSHLDGRYTADQLDACEIAFAA